MNQEPKLAYVYQPESANTGPRLFAVAGPGAETFHQYRYTKEEATRLVERINAGHTIISLDGR